MAKLLETKLPYAVSPVTSVTAALLFNRLVRILELSLGRVDIGATINVNETQRNINQFNKGDVIWNLSTQQLQLWTGEQWVDIYQGSEKGVEGVTALGNVSISTGGSTTIILGE
jgi:hypothetical protein|tara:strand:- start:4502 stop:4843 length:342 start_codon:yes stop_codon:yes gene_type:complete